MLGVLLWGLAVAGCVSRAEMVELGSRIEAEEVDEVVVTLNGTTRSATRDQLLEAFGPRQLDPDPDEDTDLGDILVWAVVVVLIIVVLIKVVGFLRRLRRRSGPGLR